TIISICFIFSQKELFKLSEQEHTPLIPSQEGNKKSEFKERISPGISLILAPLKSCTLSQVQLGKE
ncbi:MAG TPA: hypothetical protein PK762_09075, partial [Candidatus Kapabacteria bacterium]|nr:hypothetical protein [Candidatus Kapabacteria bacterium]